MVEEIKEEATSQRGACYIMFYVCLGLHCLTSFCVSFVLLPIWEVDYLPSQPPMGWRAMAFSASICMGLTSFFFRHQLVEYTMFGAQRSWPSFFAIQTVGTFCTASGLVMYFFTPVTALGCTLIISARASTLAMFMIFGNVAFHNPTTPNFEILEFIVKIVGSYCEALAGLTTGMRFFARSMWWEGVVTIVLTSFITYALLLVKLGHTEVVLTKLVPHFTRIAPVLGISAKIVILLISFIRGIGETNSTSDDVGDLALFIYNGCFTGLSLFITVFAFFRSRRVLERTPSLLGAIEKSKPTETKGDDAAADDKKKEDVPMVPQQQFNDPYELKPQNTTS
eukprot:PhF_6_TR38094/c0_g1_i2/m.56829